MSIFSTELVCAILMLGCLFFTAQILISSRSRERGLRRALQEIEEQSRDSRLRIEDIENKIPEKQSEIEELTEGVEQTKQKRDTLSRQLDNIRAEKRRAQRQRALSMGYHSRAPSDESPSKEGEESQSG